MKRRTLLLGGGRWGRWGWRIFLRPEALWQYARGLIAPGTTGTALDKINHVVG
jgi:hypothetical protein